MATQPMMEDTTDTGSTINTRLPSRWLGPARAAWLVVCLLFIGMYVWFRVTTFQHPLLLIELYNLPIPENYLQQTRWIEEFTYRSLIPLGYLAMALLLFKQRSNDWLALFVSAALVGTGMIVSVETDDVLAAAYPDLRWAIGIIVGLPYAGFLALALIFPDGRFVPRWSWLLLPVLYLAVVLYYSPLAQTQTLIVNVTAIVFVVSLLACILAQIYRYRQMATPTQRQQTKWVLVGIGSMVFVQLVGVVSTLLGTDYLTNTTLYLVFSILVTFFTLALPAALVVSTMRYRLWDVDYVINRSLVYAIVTVVMALVFVGVFVLLHGMLESVLGSEQAIVAAIASTGIVVTLFNPARRRMRALVDRGLYGIEIDYATPARQRAVRQQPARRTSIGNFTGLEPAGSGGMAEVYRANHPTLNTTVAVKVLPARLSDEGSYRARFEREAQATARLKHPNIVQLHDFGVDEDGTSYMVMEYVSGIDLGGYLKQRGAMAFEEALPVLQGIAAALDYAHSEGLVHRDVKPSNVLLDQSSAPPRPVLSDFGIARIVTANTRLTATGGILGTFDYISPEQIQASADVDGRADVYSLGVMAYQMLTGELPFHHGNPGAILMAHMMQPPPDASKTNKGMPRTAAKAIMQAMAKSPDERFGTAGAFVAALA